MERNAFCLMANISTFLQELRRRGVYGTVAIYIVAVWICVQVASEMFPAFDIPELAIRYVWIGAVWGFPLALIVGWMYEFSMRGISRTQAAGGEGAGASLRRFDYLLLAGIAAIAFSIVFAMLGEILKLEVPRSADRAARIAEPNSVAVLPLDNFTGDQEQDYFVAGLHEALTAGLTSIRALKVISRTSASAFANTDKTLPEIGRELGVANIIEGSVFRSGDRIRVTVQLINAQTDEHLWVESYEREMVDLLALQGEVTRAIAQQIQVVLSPEEQSRLASAGPVDPKIYELHLKGMYFLKQYTPEGVQRGLRYLHQAVEKDPANPRAYAGLALGYNTIGHGMGRNAFPKAIAAARQALALDEYSGEAWAALAEAQLYYDWDWEESDKSFRRAIQLAPSLDHAYAHYAYLLALLGRWNEAFNAVEKARELSPLDPTWSFFAGWLYMSRNRNAEAYTLMQESLALAPGFAFGLYGLGAWYVSQGRLEEAIAIQEEIAPGSRIRLWGLGPTYALAGRDDDALRIAAELAMDPGPKDKLFLGFTYSALGDFDEAMRWLEDCYETRTDWLPWIALEQGWGGMIGPIRDDPRFQSLIERMNL